MEKVLYSQKSDQPCSACNTLLKQNLVNRKPENSSLMCFSCFQKTSPNVIRTAKDIRRNPALRSQKRWEKNIPLKTAQ